MKLCTIVKTNPQMPVLVVSDLNDEYVKVSFEPLKKLGLAYLLNGEGPTYNSKENPHASYLRVSLLDYIFYHPAQLRLLRADYMFKKNVVSDHCGLKAEFARPVPLVRFPASVGVLRLHGRY